MKPAVVHRPELQAFVVELDGGAAASAVAGALVEAKARAASPPALCAYRREGATLVLHHTEVPPALQGQGIAAVLVQAALDWARAERLQVRPLCSYVAAYMRRHPQTLDLLEPGR